MESRSTSAMTVLDTASTPREVHAPLKRALAALKGELDRAPTAKTSP